MKVNFNPTVEITQADVEQMIAEKLHELYPNLAIKKITFSAKRTGSEQIAINVEVCDASQVQPTPRTESFPPFGGIKSRGDVDNSTENDTQMEATEAEEEQVEEDVQVDEPVAQDTAITPATEEQLGLMDAAIAEEPEAVEQEETPKPRKLVFPK